MSILNRELEAGWGVRLAQRIGINTGEVITGDDTGPRFTTGEAVRFAKRLEEAAAPNEILIGEATHRLVRDAVVVQPSGPRTLKHGEKIPCPRRDKRPCRTLPALRDASRRPSSGESGSVLCSIPYLAMWSAIEPATC